MADAPCGAGEGPLGSEAGGNAIPSGSLMGVLNRKGPQKYSVFQSVDEFRIKAPELIKALNVPADAAFLGEEAPRYQDSAVPLLATVPDHSATN